ncbi:PAS fold-containing protein [Nocardioides exalbidus]|uniref:PAS fold-containing protein n=1 Tax=Nocardioides exalbidus TaxID=402596 RepID=A0A1H4L0I1_9ACTN|nr:PAS and ANTAR domain-containing protein [Nocardioides exalbidus]SEB64223.1 PAS fold-containing protein [Nocardioides exalbidus]
MDIHSFPGERSPGIVAPFTYDVAGDRWDWSDALYQLHGYVPREIPATTTALMHHKHPDDRERAAGVFAAVIRDGGTYSCYHRIVDRNQKVLSVVSVGSSHLDTDGRTFEVQGYYIDLTQARRDETQADVEDALTKKAVAGPVIEQAKGMIMLAEGCTADEAFARLRLSSQLANRKVADVARTLLERADRGTGAGDGVAEALERVVREARAGTDVAPGQHTSA